MLATMQRKSDRWKVIEESTALRLDSKTMPIAVASASCADGVILELGDSERVMIRSLWNLRNETYQTRETCVGPRGATSSTSQTARPPAPSEVDAISATAASRGAASPHPQAP